MEISEAVLDDIAELLREGWTITEVKEHLGMSVPHMEADLEELDFN